MGSILLKFTEPTLVLVMGLLVVAIGILHWRRPKKIVVKTTHAQVPIGWGWKLFAPDTSCRVCEDKGIPFLILMAKMSLVLKRVDIWYHGFYVGHLKLNGINLAAGDQYTIELGSIMKMIRNQNRLCHSLEGLHKKYGSTTL